MSERLTRENLHGVWAAIPTPFTEDDRFDEGVFRENVRRLHASGVHGIYTTDSDGEFYAIELDEFKQIVDAFADETQRLSFPSMVGVTWCNTQGMLDRLSFAASRGILGAHVGHPFFMPMTPASYRAFWEDVAQAVPEWFALMHYNTPRVHNTQRGPDYAVLQDEVPGLVGTKHVGADESEFQLIMDCAPHLSHFVLDRTMTPLMKLGSRGVNSWFANVNPRYVVEWYDDIVKQHWDDAERRHQRLEALVEAKKLLVADGNLHGIVSKALAVASGFLEGTARTRKPYLPVPDEMVAQFRRTMEQEFPDLLWKG